MNRFLLALVSLLLFLVPAFAVDVSKAPNNTLGADLVQGPGGYYNPQDRSGPYNVNPTGAATLLGSGSSGNAVTNPSSTLTLPSATTAYGANTLLANSATAGSVSVPSFSIANPGGGAFIQRVRLSIADPTSTAWPGKTLQVDLWNAAPTFTNGDRGAFAVATGSANHLATFNCTMSSAGDGFYSECSVSVGSTAAPRLSSGSSIYWTVETTSGSGVTGASKVVTLTPEVIN